MPAGLKIAIVGDSFADSVVPDSWVYKLSQDHSVMNYSQCGISEYRIYTLVKQNLDYLKKQDCVVLWHTNPDRVYVNDGVRFPTRAIKTHPTADLVASDSLESTDRHWKAITADYYKIFYNQAQQETYYQLLIADMNRLLAGTRVIACSGFPADGDIKSFYTLRSTNSGSINHFDAEGNQIVLDYIKGQL
jgi:hypothetical protein